MTANPLMHWPMDEISVQLSLDDASGNGYLGQVNGAARAVPDERFGGALNFTGTGQYVLPSAGKGMTVPTYTFEVWVRTAKPGATVPLFNRRDSADVAVNLKPDGSVEHHFATTATADNVRTTPAGVLSWDTWQHVAVTNDGSVARIYVNGDLADEWDYPGTRPTTGAAPIVLAANLTTKVYTVCRLAHLRGYDGALAAAEIQRDLTEDASSLAAFVRAHPLDVELLNVDEQPVLFIDNAPSGQPMTLRLTNSSRQNIVFQGQGGLPDPVNNHVTARLRPGVLSTPATVASGTDGWKARGTTDGTALYLMASSTATIAPGAWLDVALTGLSADPGGGSRGTRVEFDYQHLKTSGEVGELTGTRLQYLDVVNHRGRPDIPLVIGFAGADTLLNDAATPGDLTAYVANTSTDTTIKLVGGGTNAGGSVFTLTFDVGGAGNAWALAESVFGVSVDVDGSALSTAIWSTTSHDLDTRASWTIYPSIDVDLPPGKALTFTVNGIVAGGAPGRAALVVGWENIPGYRDGAQTLEADKRPLGFAGGQTGVGTLAPAAKLHLLDQTRTPGGNGSLLIGPPTAGSLKIGYGSDHAWLQSGPNAKLALNPSGGMVVVGATSTTSLETAAKMIVVSPSQHLQLRRPTGIDASGSQVFLELFQEQQSADVYPGIRFHQYNRFWHLLEARPDGMYVRFAGDHTSMADFFAKGLHGTSLTVGATTVNEDQLKILAQLAAGTLTVVIHNDEDAAVASPMQIQTLTTRPYVIGLEPYNQNSLLQRFRLAIVPS